MKTTLRSSRFLTGRPAGAPRLCCCPRVLQARSVASRDEATGSSAARAASPLNSTMEVLENSQAFTFKSLDQTEDELEAYCSMLSDDESASTCWDAYDYLETKRKEAEEGCAQELMNGGKPGPHCSRLEALGRLTYELIGSGQVSNIVHALATLSRAEKRLAEQAAAKKSEAVAFLDEDDIVVFHTLGQQELESRAPDRRDYLRGLFARLDRNHDGKMDMEEFRSAMRALGDELDGDTVAMIGEAMDAHGHLDEDQFIQVVEAEQEVSQDKLARMWRQHKHKQEPHYKWGGPEG